LSKLTGRSFLKELDFTQDEWKNLLAQAAALKAEKHISGQAHRLRGKSVALIFEKTSTRTRCAFEVAAAGEGAHTTYLDPAGSQMGHKESVADTARVLGRMYDAIEYRGSAQSVVEELAAHAGVPVYNGLTDEWHPTQALCDALTMREHSAKPDGETSFGSPMDTQTSVCTKSTPSTPSSTSSVTRILAPVLSASAFALASTDSAGCSD